MNVFSEKLTRRQYQHDWKYRERGAHARIVYATETPNSAATNNAYGRGQYMHRSGSEHTYDRDEEIQPLLAEPVNTQGKETARRLDAVTGGSVDETHLWKNGPVNP